MNTEFGHSIGRLGSASVFTPPSRPPALPSVDAPISVQNLVINYFKNQKFLLKENVSLKTERFSGSLHALGRLAWLLGKVREADQSWFYQVMGKERSFNDLEGCWMRLKHQFNSYYLDIVHRQEAEKNS
jgi:hypothetical protein